MQLNKLLNKPMNMVVCLAISAIDQQILYAIYLKEY